MKAKKVLIYSVIIANLIAFITMIVCFFTGTNPELKTMSVNAENEIQDATGRWRLKKDLNINQNLNADIYFYSYKLETNNTYTEYFYEDIYYQGNTLYYTRSNTTERHQAYSGGWWGPALATPTNRNPNNYIYGPWYLNITAGDTTNASLLTFLQNNATKINTEESNYYVLRENNDYSKIVTNNTYSQSIGFTSNVESFTQIEINTNNDVVVRYKRSNNTYANVYFNNGAISNRYKYIWYSSNSVTFNLDRILFILTFYNVTTQPTTQNISTLKNTVWFFNEKQAWFTPRINDASIWGHDYILNFSSNGDIYTFFQLHCDTDETQYNGIHYKNGTPGGTIEYAEYVYRANNEKWTNQNYRKITIIDGQDVTNKDLINYILDFAVPVNLQNPTGDYIDIPDMMLKILSMPFSFISTAFNVTLWPGTAYAFNFSNFIKGLIAIATILFIIKLFTSGMGVISNYTGKADTLNKKSRKPDKKTDKKE